MSAREYYENLRNQGLVEPRESEKFYPSKVQALVKETLEFLLKGYVLDPLMIAIKADEVTKAIKEAVKNNLNIPRYKIVVQTVLGGIEGQGLTVASKCLWDVNSDNYSSYTYKTDKLYCTVMVFGCYNE